MAMLIWDTAEGYGIVSRLFHWLMAVAIFAMFVLGVWMVRLDYYSPYYNSAPSIHRSVGLILMLALVLRLVWRAINRKPAYDDLSSFERRTSYAVHWAFYVLLLALMISGYLISTLDGSAISAFGWFEVPALVKNPGLETSAGNIHRILAYLVIGLAAVHSLAALKHHVLDGSPILIRMWLGPKSTSLTSDKESHS